MFNFEKLNVYQEGLNFVDLVYLLSKQWDKEERFGLISQIKRASTSIVLNIAEGSGRSKKDFRHFIDMSRSSVYECVSIIMITKRQKILIEKDFDILYEECDKLARMLTALKKSLV